MNNERQRDRFKGKLIFWFSLTGLGFLLIIVRVWHISLPGNLNLPQWKTAHRPETRGSILDRNGSPLALTIKTSSVFVRPEAFTPNEAELERIAKILNLSSDEIKRRVKNGTKNFAWLLRQTTPETGQAILDLTIPGIEIINEPGRVYPHHELAGQLIGFCGVDHVGLSGLEKTLDPILLPPEKTGSSIKNVVLTIDRYMQYIAEDELQTALNQTQASQGSAIIFQPQTGEILALASLPSFDPNRFGSYPQELYLNPVVSRPYEPGSTFKVFSAAWLIENGLASSGENFDCPGAVTIYGDHTVECTRAHGRLDLKGVITRSCNVGMIQFAERIKASQYRGWLASLGFGQRTGLQVPGEAGGILRESSDWSGLSRFMISIGYECSATPLQMVRAASALANGGLLMQPILVKAITGQDGQILEAAGPSIIRRVIRPETSRKIMEMQRSVVLSGTGVLAALEEIEVAGKTGTAYIAKDGGGGYYKTRYTTSFIGFLPWKNPNLAIIVLIREPQGDYEGGTLAAPIFKRIARRTLLYLNQKLPPILGEAYLNERLLPRLDDSSRESLLKAYRYDEERKQFTLIEKLTDHQKTELTLILQESGVLE